MCHYAGKSEHKRTAQFIIEYFFKSYFCTQQPGFVRTMTDMEQHEPVRILPSEDPHCGTKVLVLHGHHVEAARSRVPEQIAKLHGIRDRSLTNCIQPDQQAPRAGTVDLSTRVPEQDAIINSPNVKIIFVDVHTVCDVTDLHVDANQFTKATASTETQ